MAKRRRLTKTPRGEDHVAANDGRAPLFSGVSGLNPTAIALGMLAGAVVYVTYYPSDSVAVEKGDALWFGLLAVIIATISLTAWSWQRVRSGSADEKSGPSAGDAMADADQTVGGRRSCSLLRRLAAGGLNVAPWLLAFWMMVAAFGSSPPGNLRMATNEAWLWITAACIFTAARILLGSVAARQSMVGLLVICGCGLSVHGMHQYWVSLPQNRAEYRVDPEEVLRRAMLDAPPGSAERMVFENRLMDGGPTATFALANSLAAVLLVAVVLSLGVLLLVWSESSWLLRIGWFSVGSLCAVCLIAARSRSATLAMLFALVLLLVAATRVLARRRKALTLGMFGLVAVGTLGAVLLAMFGNREWFEEAPASLAFRFQYWRSTWQMVLDRPQFGAGPGNFQAIYERYRESTATEQIAEPHNLFMETLASGGFVALALLVIGGLCGIVVWWLRGEQHANSDHEMKAGADRELMAGVLSRWVWLGALASLALIWMLGWISRRPPDLDASCYVLPAVLLCGWVVASSVGKITGRDLDALLVIAFLAVGIHLMVSGGWTVPGVAIVIWLVAGMLVPVPENSASTVGEGHPMELVSRLLPVGAMVIGASLLIALWGWSLKPVEQRETSMARAADAQSRNRPRNSLQALLQGVEADPWSPDAVLWLADFYRWRLVLDGDSPELRQKWEQALEAAKTRGGEDPAVYRMVGAQQLHVFQRLGVRRDRDAAADSFAAALRWSPANQWMFAQMAVIERARGNLDSAASHSERAQSLSRQGDNIERDLSRQMVYIPQELGVAAERGPVRVAADQLLAEPNGRPARNSAH